MPSVTPLIFAHRGASHDAPENTLAAFDLARQMASDGIELDTSLSRDGVPVVIHDLHLDKTTNGSGRVDQHDVKALKHLDAGSHFDQRKGISRFAGESIPTLDEVLGLVGKSMIINIELKSESWRDNGLETAVLAVIKRHQLDNTCLVSSFNPFALRRFHALAPHILLGYLYSPDEPFYLRYRLLLWGLHPQAYHPHHTLITAPYMEWAKAQAAQVNTWTVDDPQRMRELHELGVNALITNRPDVARQTLR